MFAKVLSGTTIGLNGVLIKVEVDVASKGFPAFNIVGLPSKSIDEAKERVRTAIVNADYDMPDSRITINLAPADIPKEGSSFDLPIAIGILAASGIIKRETLFNKIFLGELSLEGEVRPVAGVISVAILAREKNINKLFIPQASAFEVSLVDGVDIYPIEKISDLIFHLNGVKNIIPHKRVELELKDEKSSTFLFENIKGQELAKRALEIAASGFHNVHMKGPPGTGKTLLSRAFPSILPPMEKQEILEVTQIYSITGLLKKSFFIKDRPFRSPHHTTSRIGLVGGGQNPLPGEISLAHRGVLFLDELPEFTRSTLEALRQPIEDGEISISRAKGSLVFPCRFILLSASNPCPCGFLGHPKRNCHCLPGSILKYNKKLSGPLMDRIDINIDVAPVDEYKLTTDLISESSLTIKERVIRASLKQRKRFRDSGILTNGEMTPFHIKKFCRLSNQALDLLKQAITKLSISARCYFKTIKVAQTIADLEGSDVIESKHVAEALQFRSNNN